VFDLVGDVVEHAHEVAAAGHHGCLPHQDPEPVGLALDVVQERERGLFEQFPGVAGGQRGGHAIQ
jgi:hypothetical protein